MNAEEAIAEALGPTVQAAGLGIWDVERSGTSLRVLVDRPGGVDLDAVAEVTTAISAVLDERDDLVPAGRYTLEVSSPGLERRLRYPRHFGAYIGQEVAVKTTEAIEGSRRLRGRLTAATESGIALVVQAEGQAGPHEVQVPMALVERANTVFSWGTPARAAKGPGARSTTPRRSGADEGGQNRDRAAVAPGRQALGEEAR
jgi:ribosome maturation factor RimP